MSLLNSKFGIVSVDNPLALGALAQVLAVPGGMTVDSEGTPVAGSIPAGAICTMTSVGEIQLGSTAAIATQADKQLVFIAIDGNQTYSGSYVQKVLVLQGGFTMNTDQFLGAAGDYTPGLPVTFESGKVTLLSAVTAPPTAANAQIIGYVGPAGGNATSGFVQIIIPQGCGI